MNDARWRRSLASLGLALERLEEVLREPVEKNAFLADAAIQRFEFTIELFWKTLKHLLALRGQESALPLDILRQAYAAGWLDDEEQWLSMMRDRNLTSHTYNQDLAREICGRIKVYGPALRRAYDSLRARFPL